MDRENLINLINQMRQNSIERYKNNIVTGKEIYIPSSQGKTRALIHLSSDLNAPVYFNLHGGGFVMGCPENEDHFCQRLYEQTNMTIINIDYVLAPEHTFPEDKEEVYSVIKYVVEHADMFHANPKLMVIGGHSAGANIAAAVCMTANNSNEFQFVSEILDYPPLDIFTSPYDKFYAEGAINPQIASAFDKAYRSEEDAKNPLCSPVFATNEQLIGLPPALIITCEIDSLREEAEEYAKKLMQAGVEVTGKRFYDVAHGFTMGHDKKAIEAQQYIIDYIKYKLNLH